jgi:predicted CoA-binding protein
MEMKMNSSLSKMINRFLEAKTFAVVGASTNRAKYGNKVLRCYLQNGRDVIPVHPEEEAVEGISCVAAVGELPASVTSISVVTPPAVTEQIVRQAAAKGIVNIWMQPGAESQAAVAYCREQGINVIADGSCLLVVLGYREG